MAIKKIGVAIPVADFTEDNTQRSVSSGSTVIITRTLTLRPGRYWVIAKIWVFTAPTAGSLSIRKDSTAIGGTDDPRDIRGNRVLFATFDTLGGSVTIDVLATFETGTAQYGISGDPRFGQELLIVQVS